MPKEIVNLKKLDELSKNNPLSYGVMIYYDINKDKRKVMKSKTSKKKYTLNQVGETVDKLVTAVSNLTQAFVSFKQEINNRLDYIVSANKLKDLPRSSK